MGQLDERDMRVFYNVQLTGFQNADGRGEGGLQLAVSFQLPRRVAKWESFPGLMHGNLLCLSPLGRFSQAGDFILLFFLFSFPVPTLPTVNLHTYGNIVVAFKF